MNFIQKMKINPEDQNKLIKLREEANTSSFNKFEE